MDELDRSFLVLKLIKRVSERMKKTFHKNYGEMKITAPQGMLIGILAKEGPLKVSDLSEKMLLSNSTVSGIIDRLEKMGHVERIRSEEDRRVVMVDLNKDFKCKMKSKFDKVDDILSNVMQYASSEELDSIIFGLKTLNEVFIRYEETQNQQEEMNESK